jgi:rhamnosyltransferase subunit B
LTEGARHGEHDVFAQQFTDFFNVLVGEKRRFFGAPPERALPNDVKQFLAAGEAPVVFIAGTFNFHLKLFAKACIELCERLHLRGIILEKRTDQIPALPDHMRLLEFLPLSALLPHADLLVHHGGIGTCAEALRAGIPSLIFPKIPDQEDNAERLSTLGVGVQLPQQSFHLPEKVDPLVHRLLHEGRIWRRCRRYAQRLAALDSLDRFCKKIRELTA